MPQSTKFNRLLCGALALICSCPIARANPPRLDQQSQATPLRVMSFNIRYGTAEDGENAWELRREILVDMLRRQRPTVLGLQEALRSQLDELDAAFPGYQEVGVGRDDGEQAGEYAAILYDTRRLEAIESGTFWFSDTPQTPGSITWGNACTRICTWMRCRDRQTDRTFYVYNVHWDHQSQPSREKSAALLIDRIVARDHADNPVLVLGDFNAGEQNPAFRHLLGGHAVQLRDAFRVIFPAATDVGTGHGFRGTRTGHKIDSVLASEGWQVHSAAILHDNWAGRYPSDHFPVTACVSLPSAP